MIRTRPLPSLAAALLGVLSLALPLRAQDADAAGAADAPPAKLPHAGAADEPRGLRLRTDAAVPGLSLVAPLNSRQVHLVDLDGEVVHTWKTANRPGAATFLLDNGHLLHCGQAEGVPRFRGGGIGGVIQEIDFEGNVVWEFRLADERSILHHDATRMPNGNYLVIAWEFRAPGEAAQRGRDPEALESVGFWPDVVHEVRPTPPLGGEIVWTWRAWDHLVQDFDPERQGYGALAEHPGRIDINADHRWEKKEEDLSDEEKRKRDELAAQMAQLGYTGGADADAPDGGDQGADDQPPPSGDFMHTNSVAYLPEHDLIVLSSPHLCEIFVIDHSTTTEQAATSAGGRYGRGGELLWRWGNPRNYGHGGEADQKLFYQHHPTWITDAGDGSLRVLLFNNGGGRPDDREYSAVEELVLPFDAQRGFLRAAGQPFGPADPIWSYAAEGEFFSAFISGAQRLPNGNTLICEGARGRVFEVNAAGDIVWDWISPLGGEIEPSPQGGRAPPKALFRAQRYGFEHPALAGRF